MREILNDICLWGEQGKRCAVAMVIGVERSAPRGAGAALAVSVDGLVAGSVSGGCVEPAVYEEAHRALQTRRTTIVTYGISDDQAFEVGLTCGGTIHLSVLPVGDAAMSTFVELKTSLDRDVPAALAILVEADDAGAAMLIEKNRRVGTLGDARLDDAVADDALAMLDLGETKLRNYDEAQETQSPATSVFIQTFLPPPRMYIFGAIDVAASVVAVGKLMGYRVTVCDARAAFATPERFPDADEVVVRWPHEYLGDTVVDRRSAICVLTHDLKFDVPLLQVALRSPAAYVGAMGSRRMDEVRRRALVAAGVSDDEIERLSSPIGMDIGSVTPEEVAVSIAAEIIALARGGPGGRLTQGTGTIHPRVRTSH